MAKHPSTIKKVHPFFKKRRGKFGVKALVSDRHDRALSLGRKQMKKDVTQASAISAKKRKAASDKKKRRK